VCACVCVCVRVCVRACVRACVCVHAGVSDRVELIPHDTRRTIAAGATLETCGDAASAAPCSNLSHVSVTVRLNTQHIGKGCDRDTYSLESQRKLCGKPATTVLPTNSWRCGVCLDSSLCPPFFGEKGKLPPKFCPKM